MISAEDCRRFATECEQRAQRANSDDRAQLLRLAREWRAMAELQSRKHETRH